MAGNLPARSLPSFLFLASAYSRAEFAGSVIELSWPSGFEGSKKTSVGILIFLFPLLESRFAAVDAAAARLLE